MTKAMQREREEKSSSKATRAVRSLVMAVSVPLSLTTAMVFLFGSGPQYRALNNKPFWFPPLWIVHVASMCSSALTGFAAWLFWADGGFHADRDALPLFIAQVSLSIVWAPLVLVIGSPAVGLIVSAVHLATLFACYRRFRLVNPFAKDLIKPCLVWTAYLTLLTCKLITL